MYSAVQILGYIYIYGMAREVIPAAGWNLSLFVDLRGI